MKKIDVQSQITKYFSVNNLIITDALGKQYSINSYDQYIECFEIIKNTYQNSIGEYLEEGKNFLNLMQEFVSKAMQESETDNIEQYIINHIKESLKIGYNRAITISSIHPNSFSVQRECSREAFKNVYIELGYEKLKQYIELVKNPSYFISYLNDTNKQIVAMKYLLFKTDHHSPQTYKRDLSAKTIYQETSNNLIETINTITNEKDDFINYMNNEKEKYNTWFQDTNTEIKTFKDEHSEKLVNIEKTYEEKLKIEKPAEFMLEQSNKYRTSTLLWSFAIIFLSIVLIILLIKLINPQITFNDKIFTINILSNDVSVYSRVILLAIISLILYLLRIFIKMATSSKHLMEEYKQKYALTYFYLSLVNNGRIDDDKAKNIILTSLFTKAETGLLKNDNSSDNAVAILSQLQSIK